MEIGDYVMINWSHEPSYIGKILKITRIIEGRLFCDIGNFEFDQDNSKNLGSTYIKLSPAMRILFDVIQN